MLPLIGKTPVVEWTEYQQEPPTRAEIETWIRRGLFKNVGIACGTASQNLIVIDFDGIQAYQTFVAKFPMLADTFTVLTGSGVGHHVYLYANILPQSRLVLNSAIGNIELRSTGLQVAAPPSRHPDSKRRYTILHPLPVRAVQDLNHVVAWLNSLQPSIKRKADKPMSPAPTHLPELVSQLAAYFRRQEYKQKGDWLNGPCIYPEKHSHSDNRNSFGFNVRSGYGNCFRCGSILAKNIAARVGIQSER